MRWTPCFLLARPLGQGGRGFQLLEKLSLIQVVRVELGDTARNDCFLFKDGLIDVLFGQVVVCDLFARDEILLLNVEAQFCALLHMLRLLLRFFPLLTRP